MTLIFCFPGTYTHSSEQDYPSVSQINHKVKENSVNIIFAVTEEQFGVYDLLQQNVEGSSVGTLSNDSSNIVELGMISHKKSLITIFVHKHKIKNFIKKFDIFHKKISTAFDFGLYLE